MLGKKLGIIVNKEKEFYYDYFGGINKFWENKIMRKWKIFI